MNFFQRMKLYFKTVPLGKVFGIQGGVPSYTYVNRSRCDEKLEHLLTVDRHVVLHGASKQGKSVLRKKIIDSKDSITIQCLPEKNIDQLFNDIARNLGITFLKSIKTTGEIYSEGETGLEAGFDGGKISGKSKSGSKYSTGKEFNSPSGYEKDYNLLAQKLRENNKRLVFEDFHYLDEDVRKKMAFELKALYEAGIYTSIVGIWSEQNLLTYYNGDLSGRVEEIDLQWTDYELHEVLKKGECALNIRFTDEIRKAIVKSSYNNVGLLQRLAEKVCFLAGVTVSIKKYKRAKKIEDINIFTSARNEIINDVRQRYLKIYEVFERGFEETDLKVYYNIFKAISTLPIDRIIKGIAQAELLNKVQEFEPRIRLSDLTAALNRIEKLQSSREITPFLVMYNENTREVHLVDREFIFYREFGNPNWDWLI